MRFDKRKPDQLRRLTIKKNFTKYADGSVLISMGETKVICNATIEDKVPPHLKGQKTGWITAEYAMLPRSGQLRTSRKRALSSGRTHEIQRLIGRSLRAVVDLNLLGERTITVDCDVIQADGGTRTASVSGAYAAVYIAIRTLLNLGEIEECPMKDMLAAVSVGIVGGKPVLDLCYEEDVDAEVDMNV
ncbi:ribonuclease PH, partial [bacterium]